MYRTTKLVWLLFIIAIVTLAGCGPAGGPLRPLTDSELATIIAATNSVRQTQEYPTLLVQQLSAVPDIDESPAPTATASLTPYPSYTPPPSLTPLPTPRSSSETSTPVGMTGLMATVAARTAAASGSSTPATPLPNPSISPTALPEYACEYIGQKPDDFVVYKPGKEFDVFWTIKNTGSQTWDKNNVDLVYVSGAILHRRDAYDLKASVPPETSVAVGFDAFAPDIEGGYSTVWALVLRKGNGEVLRICRVTFAFDVRTWGEP